MLARRAVGLFRLQRRWKTRKTRSEWPAAYRKAVQEWLQHSDVPAQPPLAGEAIRADQNEAIIRRLPVRLLTTVQQSEILANKVLGSGQPAVAVDCSGEVSGRFGRLGVLQLATEEAVFLVDVETGGPEMLGPLEPVFQSTGLVKVFHDCREAVSLLLNRYRVSVHSVFDTQVAYAAWLEREGLEIYQAGLAEVLRTFSLSAYRLHRWDRLERNAVPGAKWHQRPLQPQAVEGVVHLLALQQELNRELGDLSGTLTQRRSASYVHYAQMNCEVPEAPLVSGQKLQAMLASRKPEAAYFKLNHPALGAALDREDLKEFLDLKPGDVAACVVKSLSPCQSFAHLQREGHGNLWLDRLSNRMVHLPTEEEVDQARPPRASSMYDLNKGSRPAIREEPRSFKPQKPTVVHKLGKRGAVKVKKSGFVPPEPQHRSFPA
ncbi:unnamed protein product [Effrenium voratum]|uniref:3'-5' exonuclease domain-containing protein n=1 Tax=Effrenium voratum TaxID=2562239 RepID=A0AA36MWA8_9DINO|nr:unnamed protein product [Effrenium voratum]